MTQEHRFKIMEEFGFGPNVMKNTKVCEACGQVVKADASFCPGCGAELSGETLFDRYRQGHTCCPACDTVLPDDARFCPRCGVQLRQMAADPPA